MPSLLRRLSAPALFALLGLYLLAPVGVGPLPAKGGTSPEAGVASPLLASRFTGPEAFPPNAADPVRLLPIQAHDVVITGSGWGHSVGLSQYGARAMALAGWTGHQILGHYYPGVKLGRLRNAAPMVRVNLFTERNVNAGQVSLSTASRDAVAPTRAASIELGDGAGRLLPFGEVWQVVPDDAGPGLALRDAAGVVRGRGPGPALVRFAHTRGRETLLALPQLRVRLQWGTLEIHRTGGTLQPVLVVPTEQYLRGIAEMPSDWPAEALRAQAITARTYALRQVQRGVQPGCRCHLGTTQLHQVYAGWIKEVGVGTHWTDAVEATAGQVVSYEGQLAWTYFSSSHGGHTENSEDSWAYPNAIPYLRAVNDRWSVIAEADNPYATWTRRISNADFARALGVGLVEVQRIEVVSRTPGGTPVELEVTGLDRHGARHTVRWRGTRKGIAGADLKLAFRAELPSQQLQSFTIAR